MVDVAMVRKFDLPVGTFRWDEQYEIVRFEYDHSFMGRGLEPSPLMMPVREGRIYSFAGLDKETFKGLPGMLADSLPVVSELKLLSPITRQLVKYALDR